MPAKKTSKKKAAKKRSVKSGLLKDVKPEYVFYLCDGRVLKNLKELKSVLTSMDDGIYYYHVNQEKNDFANWIHDVMKDFTLARQLRSCCSKVEALKAIHRRLKA